MKYVFFGTPRFATIVLGGLLNAGMTPVALVANPDRPVGRKKIVTPPPTKELIASHNARVEILQPEKLDDTFVETLKKLKPDFFVVAAYAKIIPKAVLDIPRLGTLGVHPSLLPKYRGSSPIQSAILADERETGTTIYLMDAKMDHGQVLAAAKIKLDSLKTSYSALEKYLAELGANLLIKIIPAFCDGHLTPKQQDEAGATFTKKFTSEDGFVTEDDLKAAERGDTTKAETIVRKINALGAEPGVWTMRGGKRLKLLGADVTNGSLKLTKTQKEGGKPVAL